MRSRIWIRRAYEPPSPVDGRRVLVDRLWPRGINKSQLHIDAWVRALGPTDELRRWLGHDPAKWVEFRARYRRELDDATGAAALELADLVDHIRSRRVTLVFGARDTQHNNAVALREYLGERTISPTMAPAR
jgi:uncharacterized protein YeaO (DUF488 family)